MLLRAQIRNLGVILNCSFFLHILLVTVLTTVFPYILVKPISFLNQLEHVQWHPTPVLLPGKSHGRRSLVGCSPWGRKESDTTEHLHFHFSLSCIGDGNGDPLQCSCLENPRDGGAWWAAIYGVAQSRTRLKRLSSSSSSRTRAAFVKVPGTLRPGSGVAVTNIFQPHCCCLSSEPHHLS